METHKSLALGGLILGGLAFVGSIAAPHLVAAAERRRLPPTSTRDSLRSDASIDVVIPAYLEAGTIGVKISETREAMSEHPGRSRIIVVASDEATAEAASAADEIIRSGRSGKAAACNMGVASSDADVVVLTDANCTIWPGNWVREVLTELDSWDLVSANKQETGGSETAFWALERWIKRSSAGSVGSLGVAGEFIATRRADYRPIPPGAILDDLLLAIDYATRGLSVSVSSVINTTEPPALARDQWERRVRIATGLLSEALPRVPELSQSAVGRVFIAHKLTRVTVGCAGFWLALVGSCFLVPVAAPFIVGATGASLLSYGGWLSLPRPFSSACAPVALQAVPLAAAVRVLRSAIRPNPPTGGLGLWRKVPR